MRSGFHPLTLVVLALLISTIGKSVKANTVFDQPALFPGTSAISAWTSAFDPVTFGNIFNTYDNFRVTGNDTLTEVSWQGLVFNANTLSSSAVPVSGFTISVSSDNAGQPGAVLYTQSIAGNANQSAVGTIDLFGNGSAETVNDYSANLDGTFTALANTPYWLSIVANENYPALWTWTQGGGGNNSSYQLNFYSPGSGTRPGDRAFTLEAAGTPEPGSFALLTSLGLTGFVFLRRRKQARKSA